MMRYVESLSLGSIAILIAILSACVVWLLCSVFPVSLRWLWVAIVPFILAYCIYWYPVWLGADPSLYSAWALVAMIPWYLAGVISSAAVVLILRKRPSK